MKLSVATNFDNQLIDRIKDYPVHELYGKLERDFVGGGRSSYLLAPIRRKVVEEHIAYARKSGIGFNYLLNAACMDNLETTKKGQQQIRRLLDWMMRAGVSATTVANPFLLKLIKKQYPQLTVRVSVFACVDHLRKAQFWEESGADIICVDSHTINREFATLQQLKNNLTCDIELLTNNNCLHSCYMAQTHPNVMAHSSQAQHVSGGFVVDHCLLFCLKKKIENPVNFIRSDWIRPEDVIQYERIGIEHFKLVERNIPTAQMVKRVKAYAERSYEGNLLDLIQGFGFKEDVAGSVLRNQLQKLRFLFKPFKINIRKLQTVKKLCEKRGMIAPSEKTSPVYIDNKKLDGFIKRFLVQGCRDIRCEECLHCHRYAEKAVSINETYQSECVSLHEQVDAMVSSGELWV